MIQSGWAGQKGQRVGHNRIATDGAGYCVDHRAGLRVGLATDHDGFAGAKGYRFEAGGLR